MPVAGRYDPHMIFCKNYFNRALSPPPQNSMVFLQCVYKHSPDFPFCHIGVHWISRPACITKSICPLRLNTVRTVTSRRQRQNTCQREGVFQNGGNPYKLGEFCVELMSKLPILKAPAVKYTACSFGPSRLGLEVCTTRCKVTA